MLFNKIINNKNEKKSKSNPQNLKPSNTNKLLFNLNEQQKEAVTTTEGYIRVIAGPGTGKTRVIANRYAYLVDVAGISTKNILCVTFTNKAANEMKKRIRSLIGDSDLGMICTFHSFCVQLLKEDCHVVQYPSRFYIIDEEDAKSILKECFENLNITSKDITIKNARKIVRNYKNSKMNPLYVNMLSDPKMTLLREYRNNATSLTDRIFFEYIYIQRKTFGLDFDDLMIFALHILNIDKNVKEKWQKRLEYIMVDEFQDVNSSQYCLANILSEYHKNLFVVGDPDQTIYTWRGANVKYFLDFDKHYSQCKTIIMNQNYRSLKKIIAASNSLIKRNKFRIEKNLKAVRKGEGQCIYFHAKSQYEEAEWITNQILSLQKQGAKLSDIAILYRAHYVSRVIEESLMRNQIPYTLYSGVEFYRRKEIKDILSYLRLICHGDDLSFLRIINEPKRGIGKKRIKFLQEYAETHNCSLLTALSDNIEHSFFKKTSASQFLNMINNFMNIYPQMTISDLITEVLENSGYEEYLRVSGDEDRLDNVAELKQAIYEFEITAGEDVTLEDYLDHIALFTNMDIVDKKDSVKMMTVHAAKGLEFPIVLIVGLNEGIFPSRKTKTPEELEEERRLAYVALTRAENKLIITDSEGTNYDGSYRYPSRFIFNIEKVNLDYIVELPQELIDDAKGYIKTNEEKIFCKAKFNVNDKIIHPIFGFGKIIDIDDKNSCYVIKFDNMDTERSISFHAKLNSYLNKSDKINNAK